MGVKVALVVGLVIVAVAIGATMTGSPMTVIGTNTTEHSLLASAEKKIKACQSNERLPRDTQAIRLRIYAFLGPRVTVEVVAHGRVITRGQRGSGWTGGVVTIPVKPLSTTRSGVKLCFSLLLNGDETAEFAGEPIKRTPVNVSEADALPGRVLVEYMRRDRSSWWSLAPEVARRMGLGHAGSGTWSVLLVLGLMGGVVLVCSRLAVRELR
jgi:hypothetical protein